MAPMSLKQYFTVAIGVTLLACAVHVQFSSAQEVGTVKRGEVAPTDVEATERGIRGGGVRGGSTGGFVTNLIDNIFGIVENADNIINNNVNNDDCFTCSKLGDLDVFDSPLYTDCDVILLESLFSTDFEYEIEAQTAFIVIEETFTTSAALDIGQENFTLTFQEIPLISFVGMGSNVTIGHAAPEFLAMFTGSSLVGGIPTDFMQPVLCTLKPTNPGNVVATAACIATLNPLTDAGIVPALFDPAELTTEFELTFFLDEYCRADNLNFIGSSVVPAVLAPVGPPPPMLGGSYPASVVNEGLAKGSYSPSVLSMVYAELGLIAGTSDWEEMAVGSPVNSQVILTGTRVYAKP